MRVCEIFPSIQGEGKTVGELAIFIRLSGCNLKCNFCDTPYHNEGKEITNNEIVARIKKYEIKRLVITGGEPMLFQVELSEILRQLKDYDIEIETNGTIGIVNLKTFNIQYNVSPKLQSSGNKLPFNIGILNEFVRDKNNVLKYVITNPRQDIEDILTLNSQLDIKCKVYLTPDAITYKEYIKKLNTVFLFCMQYHFNLNVRAHILLWDSKRGV